MKYLVTGGAGFLGSNLCRRLLDCGHEVVCLDNFVTSSRSNVADLEVNAGFSLLEVDLLSAGELLAREKYDGIFNLACPASPVDYRKMPLETMRVNSEGMRVVLDLAVRQGIPVLQASTSEVYGDPLVHPQKEDYLGNVSTLGDRACYDEGKRFAESLCYNYWKSHGVPVKIVRIFNTYGPFMRVNDGRAVSEYIVRALEGEPLIVHGDGLQSRSFCFVDDMIDGLVAVMEEEKEFDGPVNLGNPEEISILDLAKKIIELTGSSSIINHTDPAENDPRRRCPDISKAKELYDFNPAIGLEDGLKRTIKYFESL